MVQPPDYYTLLAMQARPRALDHERRHAASLVVEPFHRRVRTLLARLVSKPLGGRRPRHGGTGAFPAGRPAQARGD